MRKRLGTDIDTKQKIIHKYFSNHRQQLQSNIFECMKIYFYLPSNTHQRHCWQIWTWWHIFYAIVVQRIREALREAASHRRTLAIQICSMSYWIMHDLWLTEFDLNLSLDRLMSTLFLLLQVNAACEIQSHCNLSKGKHVTSFYPRSKISFLFYYNLLALFQVIKLMTKIKF